MKRLLSAFFTTTLLFVATHRVLAADLTITCSIHDGCKISGSSPLFLSEDITQNFTNTKQIKAINQYNEAREFAVELVGSNFDDSSPSLADKLEIKIAKAGSSNLLYGPKKISDWKSAGFIKLTTIPAGHSEEYDLTISLKDAGNDYQNKKLKFDLSLGFEAVPGNNFEDQITNVANTFSNVLGLATAEELVVKKSNETISNNESTNSGNAGQTLGDTANYLVFWEGVRNVSLLFLFLLLLLLLLRRYRKH